MTELTIDTKKRAIRAQLNLSGEAERIEIRVGKYELERNGHQTTLTIVDASASRPWIAEALREFVVGLNFEIPQAAGALLKVLT
jgi:hypothetical protein